MPRLVDRTMLTSVFPEDGLVTWSDSLLPADLQGPVREFLKTVGLPHVPASGFLLDESCRVGDVFRRCESLPDFSEISEGPEGWGGWLLIGEIGGDLVVLAPASGAVFSLPEGEGRVELLNKDLESFVYFVYLIERARAQWDPAYAEEPFDPEGVAISLRDSFKQVDPLPFEGHEPGWSDAFDWDAEERMPTWDFLLWQIYEG